MTGPTIPLDQWLLKDFDPGATSDAVEDGWIPVTAPGDVYRALIAAGRLDDPYKGRNEVAAAWVRDREWRQRTTFTAPVVAAGEAVELVFEGLDTFATVLLDGAVIGQADNMFRRWVFPLDGLVAPGTTHALEVRFHPTAVALEGVSPPPPWAAFTDRISRSKRNLMRKAQFGWGWDWGPDLPTAGIWKSAAVEVRPRSRIADLHFDTRSATAERAETGISVTIDGPVERLWIDVALTSPGGEVVFRSRRPAGDVTPVVALIEAPRLWWTHDLGDQPLYHLSARLLDGERLVDEMDRTVGIRTIVLDQSPDPDEPGATFFRFVLNGVPIFAKGACWVPTTSFVGDVDAEPYDRLIVQAARANMNMIRVWGGGIYEPDVFYDLCDRHGLLVWQDFMFACAPYPDDAAFVASVVAEVDDQVRRLRHHSSMALWCGNNENQAIHRINVDVSGVDMPLPGAVLYDTVIPERLAQLDPSTPYWPGSPWGGPNPNSMKAGDVHDWTVWHGIPPIPDDRMIEPFGFAPEKIVYQRYAEDTARFVSELGIQAAPAMGTLKRWLDPADLDPHSEGFDQRIKDESKKALAMIDPVTGPPETLQDYIDFTQWTQAEGLKFGIEHFRRRRPQCSGALLWQFNDCWPCVSWSLVDYDGGEKAAYHAVRRAFDPVLASFKDVGGGEIELWITNDSRLPVVDRAVVALLACDGRTLWSVSVDVVSAADTSHAVWRGPVPVSAETVLTVRSESDRFAPNRAFSVPIKDLALGRSGRPSMTVAVGSAGSLEIEVTAEAYAVFVHLVSDRADLRFSDNHFDLRADERRRITVTGDRPVQPNEVVLRSWNDRAVNG